jgi:hypothetical protein
MTVPNSFATPAEPIVAPARPYLMKHGEDEQIMKLQRDLTCDDL